MAHLARAALRAPNTEAPHPTVPVERGTECQLGGDTFSNTTQSLRLQRLRFIGMSDRRARVVADLAWGEAA